MATLLYRGVAHTPAKTAPQTLADQMRRPDLVYRGVAHDGEHAQPAAPTRSDALRFYRGVRLA